MTDRGTQVVRAGLPEPRPGQPFLPGPVFAAPFHLTGDPHSAPASYGRYGNPTWEAYEHALARGARILAELTGYGATSDGVDMVAPSGEGAERCMRMALAGWDGQHVGRVDYLNTHGTSTVLGDITELRAVHRVFGDDVPPLSSTKALSGHALGAAGVHEAIYCLLMLEGGFVAGSANIEQVDPVLADFPILRASRATDVLTAMSNSFGFGGTNATLVFSRV